MKKQTKTKKSTVSKAVPAKSLTKSRKKVTVTMAAKDSLVKKTVAKKAPKKRVVTKAAKAVAVKSAAKKPVTKKTSKKSVVTKAARVVVVKTATKKPAKKAAVTKAAKAAAVKSAAKPVVKKAVASKSSVQQKAAPTTVFAKTNKPVVPLRDRPLSPHLGIYRPQITSVLSILHRATGVALYIGAFVLAGFIITLGYGEAGFSKAIELFKTPVGTVVLFAWIFCLYYHLCNGIRHLMWDMGKGFDLLSVTISGLLVLFVSLTLTFTTLFLTHPEFLGQFAQ